MRTQPVPPRKFLGAHATGASVTAPSFGGFNSGFKPANFMIIHIMFHTQLSPSPAPPHACLVDIFREFLRPVDYAPGDANLARIIENFLP